jgi:glyoxylase-like metal-dependent hydrolase (beta-lactamase superfamily II)/8-oxo-dGTP pyrophosphatase MutT (NUDIX family)
VSRIDPASAILLARPADHAVYLIERGAQLRFMPGFVAFPGGKADPCDRDAAACAARELFEETGIRVGAPAGDYASLRQAVLDGTQPFPETDTTSLDAVGCLRTPPFSPMRFETSFFVTLLPPGQEPSVWPGELQSGRWWSIPEALAAWERGELLLSPPTFSILELLGDAPCHEWAARLRPALEAIHARRMPPIWFAPGVQMIPLDAAGLPPTRYTNCFVLGTAPRLLVDPGPVDPTEQDILCESLDPGGIQAIVLTHHHPDHIGAVERLREEWNLPVWAHLETAIQLAGRVRVDQLLDDGMVLEAGRLTLEILLTPGHAPGHLALWEPNLRYLFAGDLVSPLSSVIIDPEDGDLEQYFASLQRIRELPMRLLLPSHGPPTTRGLALIDQALRHRQLREQQLLAAWQAGLRDHRALALELYRGFPDETLRLAERQIESGLIKLRREGRLIDEP